MIPRLIHRVWLGPNPQPLEHDYTAAWAATNPGWELRTWTDENVHELFPLVTQREYDAAPTYVHRADLILPEAVHALGGVAVGYDMEPLRPLDQLIDGHECWCTPDADGFAGGAFFGSARGHGAVLHVLNTIHARAGRDGWHPTQPNIDTGPWAWGEAFGRHGEHCTDFGMAVLGDRSTAYAIGYWERDLLDDPAAVAQRTRTSTVLHRFAGTWLDPNIDVTVRRADATR